MFVFRKGNVMKTAKQICEDEKNKTDAVYLKTMKHLTKEIFKVGKNEFMREDDWRYKFLKANYDRIKLELEALGYKVYEETRKITYTIGRKKYFIFGDRRVVMETQNIIVIEVCCGEEI
jgi:hypothetical protein